MTVCVGGIEEEGGRDVSTGGREWEEEDGVVRGAEKKLKQVCIAWSTSMRFMIVTELTHSFLCLLAIDAQVCIDC
jgi:hypothetical protein